MKEIKYFKNYYITTCGEVISKFTGLRMRTYLDTVGYKCVTLKNDKKDIHMRVHRLMGFTYFGLDRNDKDKQINHKDGNKLNCSILNLEILSNKQNTEHGYDNNLYTTRNRINILVYDKINNKYFKCKSIRECEKITHINRKLIKLYIDNIRNNNSNYTFEILSFDKPFRIKDENGNDFRSCRQCSLFYGFDERRFSEKCKKALDKFEYKKIKFEKYYI